MTNREEQIKSFVHTIAMNSNINDSCDYTEVEKSCIEGIRWADNHPSNETISKILNLYAEYRSSNDEPEEWGINAKDACYNFIREHWEEIK